MNSEILVHLLGQGLDFQIRGGQLFIKSNFVIDKSIKLLIRNHRELLVDYFSYLARIKVGNRIETGFGPGRVWEIYPRQDRLGFVQTGSTNPIFFSILENVVNFVPDHKGGGKS